MNITRPHRGRAFERGEGYLRLVIFLAVLAIVAYIAFQNVPMYLQMQNLKHDLAELIRGTGTMNMPVERIQPQVTKLADQYGIPPEDIKLQKQGKVLTATFNTTKTANLIVTTYEWKISEVYSQTGY